MEQTRAEAAIRADLPVTVPAPPRPASRAGVTPVVRGEHIHGEPGPGLAEPRTAASRTAASRTAGTGLAGPGPTAHGGPGRHGAASAGGSQDAPRVLQRHSVRAQVLDALRAALIEGTLVPGEVYSAPALAERFGVSATPVREAMQQLASEGAVETVPNRGFRVAEHSARDLAELAEVRAMLEVPTVLELARSLPAERWAELRPPAEATVKAAVVGDRTAYAEADRAFHRALLELTGNRQLVLTAEELHRRAQCALARTRMCRTSDLLVDASEHIALLESLERRDLAMAERVARTHFVRP